MPKVGMEKVRRYELILSVLKIVAEGGFEGVTLEGVAERAGVSKGVVAYYFKNKETLISETCKAFLEQFSEGLTQLINEELDGEMQLKIIGYTAVGRTKEALKLYLETCSYELSDVEGSQLDFSQAISEEEGQKIMLHLFRKATGSESIKKLVVETYGCYKVQIANIFKSYLAGEDTKKSESAAIRYMAFLDGLLIYQDLGLVSDATGQIDTYLKAALLEMMN